MAEQEKLRIDKFLWSIRIFKTRSLASEACITGKVKYSGTNVKPSKTVSIGDQFEIKTEHKKWVIKVVSQLHTRTSHEEAIKHYLDLSPEEVSENIQSTAFLFPTGKRKSKKGRPTKKVKRNLDDFFQNE
jgi:ribosome-associated heat shock protein Hsp15